MPTSYCRKRRLPRKLYTNEQTVVAQMTRKPDLTSDDAYLYMPRDHLLNDDSIHVYPESDFSTDTLKTLNKAGIYTYGQLLDHAKQDDFSTIFKKDVEGIETIWKSLHYIERQNKLALLEKYREVTAALSTMKQIAEYQLQKSGVNNKETSNHSSL